MRAVVEYCTLARFDINDINREVNKKLHEGWELYGSPTFVTLYTKAEWEENGRTYVSHFCYSQTMVRYIKETV